MPGPSEWVIIVIVIAVLFGASRLPAMGRNFGLGIKEFKKGIAEASRDDEEEKSQAKRTTDGGERDTPA
ncbi:MAG TPA: twin-arginine translocase TatA/TatE family subunit [Actinomycetota bacterium]|jgi:sec-independent protein translocase protein TatA|nr:twin-arginine translocase TatA/TatE family subunit [Actinomycetota bacterium]